MTARENALKTELDHDVYIELTQRRGTLRASITKQGAVHIRYWFPPDERSSELRPKKQGVTLSVQQARQLLSGLEALLADL